MIVKRETDLPIHDKVYVETVYDPSLERIPRISTFRNMIGANVYMDCVRKHLPKIKSCEVISDPT